MRTRLLVLLLAAAFGVGLACGKKDEWPGPKVALSLEAGLGTGTAPSDAATPSEAATPVATPPPDAAAPTATPTATATATAAPVVVDLTDAALDQALKAL